MIVSDVKQNPSFYSRNGGFKNANDGALVAWLGYAVN